MDTSSRYLFRIAHRHSDDAWVLLRLKSPAIRLFLTANTWSRPLRDHGGRVASPKYGFMET